MNKNEIVLQGVKVHNLKNIDVRIPKNCLVVLTGLSGSGKSSLAFDTIYAEGQRRYIESLNSYARQLLGQMEKPDLVAVEGLSPSICTQQQKANTNPRSTVGTVTEIYDYIRLLYARCGEAHCPKCSKPFSPLSKEEITKKILELPTNSKVTLLSPINPKQITSLEELFQDILMYGFNLIQINGMQHDLSNHEQHDSNKNATEQENQLRLDPNIQHDINVIVDQVELTKEQEDRLADSVETALEFSQGQIKVDFSIPNSNKKNTLLLSTQATCIDCKIKLPTLEPNLFSFNSTYGACEECEGLGEFLQIEPEKILDPSKPLAEGGILPLGSLYQAKHIRYLNLLQILSTKKTFHMENLFSELPKETQNFLLFGEKDSEKTWKKNKISKPSSKAMANPFPGFARLFTMEFQSDPMRYSGYKQYMRTTLCPDCSGNKLQPIALAVTIQGLSIMDLCNQDISSIMQSLKKISFSDNRTEIANNILPELYKRLEFLIEVGLDYLSLNRTSGTLSGGEMQRMRLATQIGSKLSGVIYVLDEPSIGLHPRDNAKLILALRRLKDLNNSLIVVEHDEEMLLQADHIIDMGPGAGVQGGEIIAQGKPEEIMSSEKSLTGAYLSNKKNVTLLKQRNTSSQTKQLRLFQCSLNNLKNINVSIPLNQLVCFSGVSGSGKSSLVNGTLIVALKQWLLKKIIPRHLPIEYMDGAENITRVLNVTQSPIGRTPRSNPATYVDAFTPIRELFSQLVASKIRGYSPSRFSFNTKSGRCSACQGAGTLKVSMYLLSDIYVTCNVCKGLRYNSEILKVKYKNHNIYDVLNLNVREALQLFQTIPNVRDKLQTLQDVGLDYLKLGQSSLTLSGGEAQRVKLSAELSKQSQGNTLYILDEPTTGLHFDDIQKLLTILNQLVEQGNSVIVIEHNLNMIANADHIIDLGPEGGNNGGKIVATGTPSDIVASGSFTGKYLKQHILKRTKPK